MKFPNSVQSEAEARKIASEMSKHYGFFQVILSKEVYYLVNLPSMIRTWEQVIITYEDGKESDE